MSDAAQPTPGPWGSRRLSTGIVITANGKDICKVPLNRYVSNDANEANARLIITAPEMREALKAVDLWERTDGHCSDEAQLDAAMKKVRAAIAKATP